MMMIPFGDPAPTPHDREGIIALVKRKAEEECQEGQLSPLLALRRVRACIHAGACDGDDW